MAAHARCGTNSNIIPYKLTYFQKYDWNVLLNKHKMNSLNLYFVLLSFLPFAIPKVFNYSLTKHKNCTYLKFSVAFEDTVLLLLPLSVLQG